MGLERNEMPAIVLAHKSGMLPISLSDIDIRGLRIDQCKRQFVKPDILNWTAINKIWGAKEL